MIFKDGVMEEIEEIDISNDIIITIKKHAFYLSVFFNNFILLLQK